MNSWIQLKNGDLFNLDNGSRIHIEMRKSHISLCDYCYSIFRNNEVIFRTTSGEDAHKRVNLIKQQLNVPSYQTFQEVKQIEEDSEAFFKMLDESKNKM